MLAYRYSSIKTTGVHSQDQATRYMNRLKIKTTKKSGETVILPRGSIKPIGLSHLGGSTDDGLGDIYPVAVDKIFYPKIDFTLKRGTEDSYSTFHIPLQYRTIDNASYGHLSSDIKGKITVLLDFLLTNGNYITKQVKSVGGSFGRGNLYETDFVGPYYYSSVIPVENKVTIPEHWTYGMPRHPHPHSSDYDKSVYFSFVKNAFIINEMTDKMISDLVEVYEELCSDSNHSHTKSRKLGEFLMFMHQGGFKYMCHRIYPGGIFVVETITHCFMKVGAPPIQTPTQKPITTGGGLHINGFPVTTKELFSDVTIDVIKSFGVHFEMYGMIPPGEIYLLQKENSDGTLTSFWTFPAPHGAFIYRPKSGKDCRNFGYVILPFGVSKEDQLQTQGIAPNLIQSRCIICLEDESATHGFVCNGHKHYLYCSSCTTHSSITTKCAICRKTHSSGPQAL